MKRILLSAAVILIAVSTCRATRPFQRVLIPDVELPTILMNSGSGRIHDNRLPGGVGDVFNAGTGAVSGNAGIGPCSHNPTGGNVNEGNIFNSGTGVVAKNGR